MISDDDHVAIARAIIDANRYMTLATADAHGRPWASPVFFATADYVEFYWASPPEAVHSQNLLARQEAGIVIFDSEAPAGTGQAVYLTATARELAPQDLEHALTIYPGPGGWQMSQEELQPPSPYRLYRAVATEHSILCPRGAGPCQIHGRAADHRVLVNVPRT